MGRKLTIEEIKSRLEIINPTIELMSSEYVGTGEKLKFRCLIDNYEWETTWGSIYSQKSKCPKCIGGKNKIFSIEEAVEKIKKVNPKINILNDNYKNSTEKLDVECTICGTKYKKSFEYLIKYPKCPHCLRSDGGSIKILDIAEVRGRLKSISPTITILDEVYVDANSKLKCRCEVDNNIWSTSWSSLSKGSGCPICSKKSSIEKQKMPISQVIEKIKTISPNIEIVPETYNGVSNKVTCKCLVENCEHMWSAIVLDIFKGSGCPACVKKYNISAGGYRPSSAENNKNLFLSTMATFYIIECWDEVEHFYKVGLTTKSIQERFNGAKKMPYNYKIIKEIKTNLYDGGYIEKFIIDSNIENKYTPNNKIKGHTECFSKLDFEKINEVLKDDD